MSLQTLVPNPNNTTLDAFSSHFFQIGTTRLLGIGCEAVGCRSDGTVFPLELTVTEFQLDGERHFTGVIRDLTSQKNLEEQFRQAQKMEAFGQLAGGVAHDFNNILTVINGYSSLLLTHLPIDDLHKESITEIREAGRRAAGLTAQLLAFSRKSIIEAKNFDLNLTVNSIGKLLRRLIGEDIYLQLDLASELSQIKADSSQIEQVLMNLAVNARDAMPKGGRLTIETKNVFLRAEDIQTHPGSTPGRYVQLLVSDTGSGMTDEVKRKIFEPFFTTKEVGKGTGLGLATVYGIVKQSGGLIGVVSEIGHGTTFTILFPAVAGIILPEETSEIRCESSRELGTILLVEDEESVRRLVRITLKSQGYEILEAASGEDAVRIAESYPGPIHLLVTDVVMPGMDGRQVADSIRRNRFGLNVLYISGYTEDAVVRHGVNENNEIFLQKPFAPLELVQKIRNVLDNFLVRQD